jgi:hypothetical protein
MKMVKETKEGEHTTHHHNYHRHHRSLIVAVQDGEAGSFLLQGQRNSMPPWLKAVLMEETENHGRLSASRIDG